MAVNPTFVPGNRYELRLMLPGLRVPRISVMTFVAESDDEFVFSLRPFAGTQLIHRDWILKAEDTDANIMLPHPIPKEAR